MNADENYSQLTTAAMIIASGVVLAGLVYGSSFLIPIVVAFLVVNVLESIIERLRNVKVPLIFAVPVAISVVLSVVAGLLLVFLNQVDDFVSAWPRYLDRFQSLGSSLLTGLDQEVIARLQKHFQSINIASRVSAAVGSAGSLMLNFGLVLLYVGFLLAERGKIARRLVSLGETEAQRTQAAAALSKISNGIRQYLFVKTVLSLITTLLSYAVLRYLNLDFAETWAVIIFLLNFIPSIGSVLGVLFPALLALVQFDTLGPFFVIAGFLAVVQFATGNILEPMLMGRSLNLSAFTIIVSLTFWSTIWGIAGAFLAVPIMSAIVILCRELPGWAWVATVLENKQEQQSQRSEMNAPSERTLD